MTDSIEAQLAEIRERQEQLLRQQKEQNAPAVQAAQQALDSEEFKSALEQVRSETASLPTDGDYQSVRMLANSLVTTVQSLRTALGRLS